MKDKRNCNSNNNYPIYQQPMMMPPMGYPIPNMYPNNFNTANNYSDNFNSLEQRVNNLEQRVNRLENIGINNNSNKYNDSNYYMV